jgi:hypothetical protein
VEATEEITEEIEILGPKRRQKQKRTGLKSLQFEEILTKIQKTDEVVFEPFSPGRTRDLEVTFCLLYLFIQPTIYATIAENTNLYATAQGAAIAPTSTNTRYWWPANANEI